MIYNILLKDGQLHNLLELDYLLILGYIGKL